MDSITPKPIITAQPIITRPPAIIPQAAKVQAAKAALAKRVAAPYVPPDFTKIPDVWERILVLGITGSGKSYQWQSMARFLFSTGAKFYVVDTDNDINYMLVNQFPDLLPANGGNVFVFPAHDWEEYEGVVNYISNNLKPKPIDWIIVDKINHAWDTVQRHFINSVYDKDMGEYFLDIRRKLEAQHAVDGKNKSLVKEALSGWMDWPVINALYNEWIAPIVYQVHCHVYATTDADKLSKEDDNVEILNLTGALGLKIDGQKKLGGQFHSIFLYKTNGKKWQIRTIKDRAGRTYLEDEPFFNFYMQYLVMTAKWVPPNS